MIFVFHKFYQISCLVIKRNYILSSKQTLGRPLLLSLCYHSITYHFKAPSHYLFQQYMTLFVFNDLTILYEIDITFND